VNTNLCLTRKPSLQEVNALNNKASVGYLHHARLKLILNGYHAAE